MPKADPTDTTQAAPRIRGRWTGRVTASKHGRRGAARPGAAQLIEFNQPDLQDAAIAVAANRATRIIAPKDDCAGLLEILIRAAQMVSFRAEQEAGPLRTDVRNAAERIMQAALELSEALGGEAGPAVYREAGIDDFYGRLGFEDRLVKIATGAAIIAGEHQGAGRRRAPRWDLWGDTKPPVSAMVVCAAAIREAWKFARCVEARHSVKDVQAACEAIWAGLGLRAPGAWGAADKCGEASSGWRDHLRTAAALEQRHLGAICMRLFGGPNSELPQDSA
jgi:hypothetical protein